MKKRILLSCAAMTWFATSAFAVGCDLSAVACPGGAGASSDAGSLDCAGGHSSVLQVTFMPAESAPDLAGIDIVLDMSVGGDIGSDATFWDFGTVNPGGLSVSHVRPATLCNDYTAPWTQIGSGEGWHVTGTSPSTQRIQALAYRPGLLAFTVDQKLFGMSVIIDPSESVEHGGFGTGCADPVTLVLNEVYVRLVSGYNTQPLTSPSVFGNCVTFNGATEASCAPLPIRKRTWGLLKSLYR